MDGPSVKKKVTAQLTYNASDVSSPRLVAASNISRSASPAKSTTSSISAANFRPKAKVNTSATTRKTNSTVSSAASTSSRTTASVYATKISSNTYGSSLAPSSSSTPRPGSPAKLTPRLKSGGPSPSIHPKPLSTISGPQLRSTTPIPSSTLGAPELRSRAFTTSSDSLRPFTDASRTQRGGILLHHTVSYSALQSPDKSSNLSHTLRAPLERAVSNGEEESHVTPPRVKAKVSGVAKPANESNSASFRPGASSTSPVASLQHGSPTHQPAFYPITTSSPAANPYRYVTNRSNPSPHQYMPFSQSQDDYTTPSRTFSQVDPAFIPLPPQSPPASALSFSSRSSVSRSSVSFAAESTRSQNSSIPTEYRADKPEQLSIALDNLVRYSAMNPQDDNFSGDSGQDRETDDEKNSDERKIKAEAKSNRKIADLEITNRSLLTINASLETTKNRQAKEIRELRRKLRESRLMLPPRTYRTVEPVSDEEFESDEESESESQLGGGNDELYARIKTLIENLLDNGKKALEKQNADFSQTGKGGAFKVLTPDEVRTWRDSSREASDGELDGLSGAGIAERENDAGSETNEGHSPSQSISALEKDTSEDEVEDMIILSGSHSPPPILITS